MLERDETVHLPLDVFKLLRDLISEYCGIYFDDSSRTLVEKRLSRRVMLNRLDDFRDYYRLLLYDKRRDEELAAIVDIITVNETYFFREQNQLKAFVDEVCVELKATRNDTRRLRIWSAGCSSGEEPYTIAMLLLENRLLFDGWNIEIVASDINRRVLHQARRGVYRKPSFRSTDEKTIRKYFTMQDGEYVLNDEVKRLVTFSNLNLLDAVKTRFVGSMDVIFCRNVLIYFNPEAKKKVIEIFFNRLNDGGYMLLGHAESLINLSTAFALKHLKNDMVYQKPRKAPVSISDENLYKMVWGK